MPTLKAKGRGLFIESFRTPAEQKRVDMDRKTEEVLKENQDLKVRLAKLEAILGIQETPSEGGEE